MPLVAVFGGTFDPIHLGHLQMAESVSERLACEKLIFLIAGTPPLRALPDASPAQRLEMVELALASRPGFEVDARELARGGKSYTVDTLGVLREEVGERVSLAWVLGRDAYVALPAWHRWRNLLDLAHLVILERAGATEAVPAPLAELAQRHTTADVNDLRRATHGYIYELHQPLVSVSATEVRKLIAQGSSAAHLLPPSVWAYITSNGLYGWKAPKSAS
jgi:nicotinate-nucleotide adenylyltransferase